MSYLLAATIQQYVSVEVGEYLLFEATAALPGGDTQALKFAVMIC
jgi:hypothetical protein